MVLGMLQTLDLQPGHRVLELGTGSGWNAALMGQLVGPTGHVYSLEIVPELCDRAARCLAAQGASNVSVIAGDGGDGYPLGRPYDRIVLTAGFSDLSPCFGEQLKEGGLLLGVIKNPGGWDFLLTLRKRGELLEAEQIEPCGFVQAMGKYHVPALEPVVLEELPEWASLSNQLASARPFWWGGKGRSFFEFRTMAFRWFLDITEPGYQAFAPKGATREGLERNRYFGLWGEGRRSLIVARPDTLSAYGDGDAEARFTRRLEQWLQLGMPSAESFGLTVYPAHVAVTPRDNQWLVRREVAQFLWKLPTAASCS